MICSIVEQIVLKATAKASDDDIIDARITETIDIYNRKTDNRIMSELLKIDDVDIKFVAKHGSFFHMLMEFLNQLFYHFNEFAIILN